MTSVSYPSKPVLTVDTPEVKGFSGRFIYNYFLPDERINDVGNVSSFISAKGSDAFDNAPDDLLARIPRFVRLFWNNVNLEKVSTSKLSPLKKIDSSGLSKKNQNFIQSNFSKVLYEEEFSNFGFSGVEFQDTGIDGKMYLLVSGTVSKMVNSDNIILSKAVNDNLEFISEKIDTNRVSLLDVSKFLAGDLDAEDLPNQTIIDALTDLRAAETRFFSEKEQRELIEDRFASLKNVKTRFRINNKFIKTVLNTSATDPLGFFTDEIGPLLERADEIQTEMVQKTNPDSISEAEFDVIVDPIDLRSTTLNSSFTPTKKHIGYIVERYERNSNGTLTELSPIILESENTNSTIDYNIAYGATYVYQIRAVYLLEFQTFSDDSDEIAISTILVASAPSRRVVVNAEETIPPPPPSDINVFWDAKEQHPAITWEFPVNTQRDIKRWQVFKRKNVDEPFELLIELDFDDSEIRIDNYETVNINLKKKLISPQNYWIDEDFNKDDDCIYTVVSIDAHGLSSNYGMQFHVKFNRLKNKIEKKLISNSGAPKPYPNMFLNSDTFVDVIKDSNHRKMTIFFDPEYLEVIQKGKHSEPFIATKQNKANYKMQLINVDFQQSQLIDIFVNDMRTIKKGQGLKSIVSPKLFKHKAYIVSLTDDITKG